MKNLLARVPHTFFPDLVSAFVPPDTPSGAVLELVITIEGQNIPVREFAAYLALIDRIYGRLSPDGLRSYSHTDWDERLKIAEIHKSDLEIIFRALYGYQDTATYIVILLFLRSLPNMIKILSESAKNFAETYKIIEEARLAKENRQASEQIRAERRLQLEEGDPFGKVPLTFEEGKLVRENRKHIREAIQQEPALEKLDDARTGQLTSLLYALVKEENSNLPAPIRFARRRVKSVILRVAGQNPPS